MLACILLTACAHTILISPDLAKIERAPGAPVNPHSVGLVLDPATRERPVITPGGGGDNITYKPYLELEVALYKMLGNVFSSVTLMKSADDMQRSKQSVPDYLFTTQITTNSSSSSLLTWPPTRFHVLLSCKISDAGGSEVAQVVGTGEGAAEFSEFKQDFGLAAKRASQNAIIDLQNQLLQVKALQAH